MPEQSATPAGGSPRTNPWLMFLLPFVVYMLAGSLEPTAQKPGGTSLGLAIPYAAYPWVYTAKIALATVAVLFVLPGYRQFSLRVHPLAVAVGAVGVVVWVGLTKLHLESRLLEPLGLGQVLATGQRSAYDPLAELADHPVWAWGFLVVRFFGLALLVPLVEESFLRGFVMRFIMERDWWKVPFGQASRAAIVAGTLVPMLMHPAELLAAAVWFSMVTWLMFKTRSLADCVVAHALTNFLLGLYVVYSGEWYFL